MKKNSFIFCIFLLLGIGASKAQIKTIHNFNDTLGAYPSGKLVLSGNVLYGMASNGGANGYGCIYAINTDGSGFRDFWDFVDTGSTGNANGASPQGSVTIIGKKIFGMTNGGGSNGRGNVFSIDSNGKGYRDLWDFDDTGKYAGNSNGATPYGNVILSGGSLYGMTINGGAYQNGNIFSIDTSGSNYRDILDFNGTTGSYPQGSFIVSEGVLYGMTGYGGVHGDGNLFSIDTNGNNYKDLYSFYGNNGGTPVGSLILFKNSLYGMTQTGGGAALGNVFAIDTDGTNYRSVIAFNGTKGKYPSGDLIISGNLLYGMTADGGTSDGNIFSIDTNGTLFTNIVNFTGTNGENPTGSLTLVGSVLYGVTSSGGSEGNGIVFADAICNLLTVKGASTTDTGNSSGTATVTASVGPTPYTYLWTPGGQTASSISGLSTGTYTCTVTDENGCEKVSDVVVSSPAGVNNITTNAAQIKVYPDPSNGNFEMQINGGQVTMDNGNIQVEIYNELGQKVYTTPFSIVNSPLSINLSNQPGGVYLYRVISASGSLAGEGKLVIQK